MNVLVFVVGTIGGFVASRLLRRPDRAAQASSVARNMSGSLGRRRGLTPPELQRACFSEMVRHVQVTRQGRTYAPSNYTIHLHDEDLALVEESHRWFVEGLTDALRTAARDNGWTLAGAVKIDFVADRARRPGVPTAVAVSPVGLAAEAPKSSGSVAIVRSDTGQRHRITDVPLTIGRSKDRDITIDDTRVSRAHARIEPRKGAVFVVDEGSSNGTTVGSTRLTANTPHRVRPGETITVGPVSLRIEAGAKTDTGTRALDDGDRRRISHDVLPPRPRSPR
ncbi:MAG: FhaA domain-containing protein [Aquihabitans sp.]